MKEITTYTADDGATFKTKEDCELYEKVMLGSGRYLTLKEAVLQHVKAAILKCRGDKKKAADLLGVSRGKIYRVLGEKKITA